ncbi:hypothetical protein [Nonomuraea sp. NPDC046570]
MPYDRAHVTCGIRAVPYGWAWRDRFGMTVTPEGRQVWLDSPGRVVG